jgi:hypothetical protein
MNLAVTKGVVVSVTYFQVLNRIRREIRFHQWMVDLDVKCYSRTHKPSQREEPSTPYKIIGKCQALSVLYV